MVKESPSTEEIVRSYLTAKRYVVDRGFVDEIAWQMAIQRRTPTLNVFVREAAWVVLSAGMRESVVRKIFAHFTGALHDFDPAALSVNRQAARSAALTIFAHERKIDAILEIAAIAGRMGEGGLRQSIEDDPQPFLCSLPYIGQVTWRHLAKNLGIQIAKPDRHLVRITRATNRPSVDALCEEISAWLGEPVPVVDLVLWRWSVLHATDCHGSCDSVLHLCEFS